MLSSLARKQHSITYRLLFHVLITMEPTNNSVEREVLHPAIHRKVRGQIGSGER